MRFIGFDRDLFFVEIIEGVFRYDLKIRNNEEMIGGGEDTDV